MSNDDMFGDAPAAQGGRYPTLMQLTRGAKVSKRIYAPGTDQELTVPNVKGRLVIMTLGKMERQVPMVTDGKTTYSDQVRGDIHVLSGDPITGKMDRTGEIVTTWDEPLVPPFVVENTFIKGVVLIGQFDARAKALGVTCDMPQGKEIFVTGVFGTLPTKGTKNPPYVLFSTTDAEKEILRNYWTDLKQAQPDPMAG